MLKLDLTAVVQWVIFLFVMISLTYLVFRPIRRLKERREATFKNLGSDVEASERQRHEMVAVHAARLESLHREVLGLKGEIKKGIDTEKDAILATARTEAEDFLRQEERQLEKDVVSARHYLDSQTRVLAGSIYAKIMGRPFEAGTLG